MENKKTQGLTTYTERERRLLCRWRLGLGEEEEEEEEEERELEEPEWLEPEELEPLEEPELEPELLLELDLKKNRFYNLKNIFKELTVGLHFLSPGSGYNNQIISCQNI